MRRLLVTMVSASTFLAPALPALALPPAPVPLAQAADVSAQSRTFVADASAGNLAEMSLARLAQAKGGPIAKDLAKTLERDHASANQQLARIAGQLGIATASSVKPEHAALENRLSALSGEAFDKAYVDAMVDDHKKDIATYERFASQESDAALQDYAKETLPILRQHLQMAEMAQARLNQR